MKISPFRLGFSALASLAMIAASADAAPILDFGQSTPANTVIATNAGNNTTLSTAGTQVTVAALAGIPAPPNTIFTENFSFSSTAAITGTDGNQMQGGFNGTFQYLAPNGTVQVAGTVTNATLSTVTNGPATTASFNASNVTFTTIAPAILATAFPVFPNVPLNLLTGTFSLTLNNLDPQITSSFNFTSRAAGIITAQVIPEPASVVMTSMALVAGLGGLGLRRVKASRA